MSAICNRKWYETYGKTQLIFMFCYCINKIQIFVDPKQHQGMKFLTTLIAFRKCLTVHEVKFYDPWCSFFCILLMFHFWDRISGNYGNFVLGPKRVHIILKNFAIFGWLFAYFNQLLENFCNLHPCRINLQMM